MCVCKNVMLWLSYLMSLVLALQRAMAAIFVFLKYGFRQGDNAPLALVELVDYAPVAEQAAE